MADSFTAAARELARYKLEYYRHLREKSLLATGCRI